MTGFGFRVEAGYGLVYGGTRSAVGCLSADGFSKCASLLPGAVRCCECFIAAGKPGQVWIIAGAQDYLVKGQYARAALGRIVRHSVERKKTEKRLLRLAMRDQLTGLVNRVFFRERVASSVNSWP